MKLLQRCHIHAKLICQSLSKFEHEDCLLSKFVHKLSRDRLWPQAILKAIIVKKDVTLIYLFFNSSVYQNCSWDTNLFGIVDASST